MNCMKLRMILCVVALLLSSTVLAETEEDCIEWRNAALCEQQEALAGGDVIALLPARFESLSNRFEDLLAVSPLSTAPYEAQYTALYTQYTAIMNDEDFGFANGISYIVNGNSYCVEAQAAFDNQMWDYAVYCWAYSIPIWWAAQNCFIECEEAIGVLDQMETLVAAAEAAAM